ncbi:S1 RNA-binding domain-containing protein [Amycolatopsis sp. SID8362]|uniref:S1 RNA-binding domain-containing protein n=1 Tax=Amycolatopsis sp. SID8362 TaxID=2690346 RepID=UPI00136DF1D4|nr:S1 RNA-binding domain-containing protein [Amycolatopsis sp. SID8362]NBH02430.1 S1 RNA-binding domain-containing protein [Amycolatopsis sp. SID8362]NED39134.1 S1 RNA-binding domain-containing protein [Amycolatopsis sp. SID8362]
MSQWQEFVAAHSEGGVLDGVVARTLPFGAFVEVAPGVHGLLVTDRVPEQGSRVTVRIEAIDVERRRFSLVRA